MHLVISFAIPGTNELMWELRIANNNSDIIYFILDQSWFSAHTEDHDSSNVLIANCAQC